MNAAVKITVEITQDDINKGERADCWRCPLALSLVRQGYSDVQVATDTAFFQSEDTPFIANLPVDVRDKVATFDLHGTMNPMKFDLDAVELQEAA